MKKLFITTKLWNTSHSYDLTMSSFKTSLEKPGTDYVDLFLIHWPNPAAFRDHWEKANAETWKAMEELYEAGKIFNVPEMKKLAEKYGKSIAQICKRILKYLILNLKRTMSDLTGYISLSGNPDTMPF